MSNAIGDPNCTHPNDYLHPGRVDGTHTVCLRCQRHVIVTDCQYASGRTADEEFEHVFAACNTQVPPSMAESCKRLVQTLRNPLRRGGPKR